MSGENDSGQDKTEEPTDKKKKDSRDEGQVAQSKDLASVGVLLSVVMGFVFFGPGMSEKMLLFPESVIKAAVDTLKEVAIDDFKAEQYERAAAPSRGSAAVAVASWRRVR